MLFIPPHLQVLIDWLYLYGHSIDNLSQKIEVWFSNLTSAFPDNPFIFLYWADAVKIPTRLGLTPELETNLEGHIPLRILDASIEKCERAYSLAPDLYLISSRIAMMLLISAFHFPENSKQFKLRHESMLKYKEKASTHINNNSVNWGKDLDDYDFDKLEMSEEEVKELIKKDKEVKS